MSDPSQPPRHEGQAATPSRRRVLAVGGATAAAVWVAPQVISVDAASAATSFLQSVVAVGNGGTIVSSPDSVVWTSRTSGVSDNLRDVAWSPTLSLYAAVGNAGTILTSPDGITWTARSSGTANSLFSVVWVPFLGGFFVAVGAGCTILTSSDGVTWTDRSLPASPTDLLGVTSDTTGTIVAVGTAGTLVTSPDGVTFALGSPITAVDLLDVHHDPTLTEYLAVGLGGDAWSSPDGAVWTAVSPPTADDLTGVASNPTDGFVISEDATVGLGAYDGATWTERPDLVGHLFAVTWAGNPINRFVAVGVLGVIATSAHGVFWTPRTSPTTSWLRGVASAV